MFVLAHGGMTVPVSFLAEDRDTETYLFALYRKEELRFNSQVCLSSLNFE